MKINKKEVYSIEDLSKEEILFLFEVIDKMQLAPSSSSIAFSIAEKFKSFRDELIPREEAPPEEFSEGECDGCSCPVPETPLLCPITNELKYLCPECYETRLKLAKNLHE
jgi:hypothetical protein